MRPPRALAALLAVFVCAAAAAAPPPDSAALRPFTALFPELPPKIKARIEKASIYVNTNGARALTVFPSAAAGIPNLMPSGGRYKYIIETLIFISDIKNTSKTDIYNALKNLDMLEGRTYYSTTRKRSIPLFQEASRIVSEKNYRKMPDTIPAEKMPREEIRYMRLKDSNFGNCYYRADVSEAGHGIRFSLTNFKTVHFLFVPVIKENDLYIDYYIEPAADGVILYGLIGVRASPLAENYVDIPSAIVKRIEVINGWITDGLRSKNVT
ncbi:MAG: hypothetical protein LBC72_04605 [Spirochaetaceae bacterium]|jgi:hypothetical protein|nr:hypothetical protein [Spirochaetaceae bacterium]